MELLRAPSAPAPAAAPALPVNRTLALPPKDYVAVATPKDLIVLHFTAGQTARSAYETWTQDPRRIATAYIVDRDGTIYEMFDPRYWASHLGIRGGPVHDRRSIGIEIANVGPLTPSADRRSLNWWTGHPFCALDETNAYRQQRYRGYEYYAAFPPTQVDAVGALVRHLVERFSIPRQLAPAARRHEFDEAFFASFRGIATHANFRKDKYDIGPAFDWEALG
jgi:N-acetyl-anhydromuramyl-L-alanine amidase AmpD